MTRNAKIDLIKAISIVFVIYNHSLVYGHPTGIETLLTIGGPFYIMQAVPIFIILATYNGVNSYMRRNINSKKQHIDLIFYRVSRLLWPYMLVVFFETLLLERWIQNPQNIKNIIYLILTGGAGPGSHFVPVMIQLVLTLPILYWLGRRNVRIMLITAFALEAALETYSYVYGIPNEVYSRLYQRYLLVGALGIWLAISDRKISMWVWIGSAIGAFVIFAICYLGVKPTHPSWAPENVFIAVWPLLLVMLGFLYFPIAVNSMITLIGKASYHIFLIQMLYFWAFDWIIANKINVISNHPMFIESIVDIGICLFAGIFFYKISEFLAVFSKCYTYFEE